MIFGMTASELTTLMGPMGVLLTVIGGGLWKLIQRADARAKAREDDFESRIVSLETTIRHMHSRETIFFRRVIQLEEAMRAKGLEPPPTIGWPLPEDV